MHILVSIQKEVSINLVKDYKKKIVTIIRLNFHIYGLRHLKHKNG